MTDAQFQTAMLWSVLGPTLAALALWAVAAVAGYIADRLNP
jgi:hypothetical protein